MRRKKSRMAFAFIMAIMIFSLTGCSGREETVFDEGIVMRLENTDVTMEEYLVYASSIKQQCEETYGEDIWEEVIYDEQGNEISFESYTKIQIAEQIRMTHLLSDHADRYNVSLTVEELETINEDARTYHDSLKQKDYDFGDLDLALVLSIYEQSALAEKVYTAIIDKTESSNGLSEEEQSNEKMEFFAQTYDALCDEFYPDWDLERDVDLDTILELSFTGTDIALSDLTELVPITDEDINTEDE